MAIELPPLPAVPGEGATAADWARYLDIARLHMSRESSEAIDRQTAQMVLMTAAATRSGNLMQQLLEQPVPSASGFSESFVMSLLRLVLDRPEASPVKLPQ
jgi:hypothetical protein